MPDKNTIPRRLRKLLISLQARQPYCTGLLLLCDCISSALFRSLPKILALPLDADTRWAAPSEEFYNILIINNNK